jgi:hypothetical protein
MRTKHSGVARIVSPKDLKRKVPMKISMHAMSHDVFKKALTQLVHLMEKGVANADARKFETGVLVAARLAPDMLPFSKQIQLTSDFAKNPWRVSPASIRRSSKTTRPRWKSCWRV